MIPKRIAEADIYAVWLLDRFLGEFDALGDEFEKKEDELFGDEGFFKIVDQVAELEKKLGIYDLGQFTPK